MHKNRFVFFAATVLACGVMGCSPSPQTAVIKIEAPKNLGVGKTGPTIPAFPWNVQVGDKCSNADTSNNGKPVDGRCPAG